MIRIHKTSDPIREDIADTLAQVITEVSRRLSATQPMLVGDVCREFGIDFDLRSAA